MQGNSLIICSIRKGRNPNMILSEFVNILKSVTAGKVVLEIQREEFEQLPAVKTQRKKAL